MQTEYEVKEATLEFRCHILKDDSAKLGVQRNMDVLHKKQKNTFDLRCLKEFGLSLNTKKKYFIVYCPMTWAIEGVYDNINDALKHYHITVEEWHQSCNEAKDSQCPHTNQYTQEFVGENHLIMKGFFQNLSMWDVLSHLHNHIQEGNHPDFNTKDTTEYTLSRISGNMQCYPENVITPYVKI